MKRVLQVRRLPQKTVVVYRNGTKYSSFNPDSYKGRFCAFRESLKRMCKLFVILVMLSLSMYGLGSYFTSANAKEVIVEKQVIMKEFPPILKKICQAESALGHFDRKSKIIRNYNKNGTFDIGKCQINSIHLADAMILGYNIFKEADNEQFALHLFYTQGSEPWSASKSRWSK